MRKLRKLTPEEYPSIYHAVRALSCSQGTVLHHTRYSRVPMCTQVYAIYGGDDSGFLPDLPVLESIFPNFGSTVVPGGGHPVYLDDPELFNNLLIELAKNITSGPLMPGTNSSSSPDSPATGATNETTTPATEDSTGSEASSEPGEEDEDSPAEGVSSSTDMVPGPVDSAPYSAGLTAVVISMTCLGLVVAFKIL